MSERLCPRCRTALEPVPLGALSLDGCRQCGGLWFDHQELTQAARGDASALTAVDQAFDQRPGAAPDAADGRLCPGCTTALVGFEFPHAPGIHLDGCPKCQGIWLDDGELARIAERLSEWRARQSQAAPTGQAAAQSPERKARRSARQAMAVLLSIACPRCEQTNSQAQPACWACGASLQGRLRGIVCPICARALVTVQAGGVQVDGCHGCGGFWLDRGEVGALTQADRAAIRSLQNLVGTEQGAFHAALDRKATLPCPVCHLTMLEHPYAAQSGIRIDSCDQCKGVWLDAGELEAVQRYLRSDPSLQRLGY